MSKTAAEIRQAVAVRITAEIAAIEIAEGALLAGGRMVMFGGSQYTQETLPNLIARRKQLAREAVILAGKG